jgi:hypothetical protein
MRRDDRGLVGLRRFRDRRASCPGRGPDGGASYGRIAALVRVAGVAATTAAGQLRMFRRGARADWKELILSAPVVSAFETLQTRFARCEDPGGAERREPRHLIEWKMPGLSALSGRERWPKPPRTILPSW